MASHFSLSEEQKRIVENPEKRLAVLAGPGSGKTKLIIERAQLSEKKVIGLAFTKAVAEEMKERSGVSSASFRTFGSLGYRYITQFLKLAKIKEIKILSDKEELGYCRETCDYLLPFGSDIKPYALRNFIRQKKCRDDYPITPCFFGEEVNEDEAAKRIENDTSGFYISGAVIYEMLKKHRKMFDFQDLILLPIHLKQKIGKRILEYGTDLLLIDEAHDLSPAELKLTSLLIEETESVFITASPEQAIYSELKEATPERLSAFIENNGFRTERLTGNFRSLPNIVELSNRVFDISTPGLSGNGDGQGRVQILGPFYTPLQETQAILDTGLGEKDAILARCNYQLIPAIVEMMKRQLPFKAHLTFNSRLVWDILNAAQKAPANMGVALFLYQIASSREEIEGIAADEEEKLMEVLMSVADYFGTVGKFLSCLKKLLFSSLKGEKGLSIATIHSAKGLEFDTVAIIGMQDGVLPHKLGIPSEELRIFYVGLTRARKQLLFSWTSSSKSKPSEYLSLVVPSLESSKQWV